MEPKIITLSKCLIIDNTEIANSFNLGNSYNFYLRELKETISFYYDNRFHKSEKLSLSIINSLTEYLKRLENKFYIDLSAQAIFNENSINFLAINEVNIKLRSFDINDNKLTLELHAVSIDVELIYSTGNYIVVTSTVEAINSQYINTITLQLSDSLSIIRLKK